MVGRAQAKHQAKHLSQRKVGREPNQCTSEEWVRTTERLTEKEQELQLFKDQRISDKYASCLGTTLGPSREVSILMNRVGQQT